MDRRTPLGSPVEGRGWLRRLILAGLPTRKPGVVPRSRTLFPSAWWLFFGRSGIWAALVLSALSAHTLTGMNRVSLLTKGPEPSNLVIMALALAILFVFRRFSRTS